MTDCYNRNDVEKVICYYLVTLSFILMYFADGYSKYQFHLGLGFYRYGLLVRGSFEVLFIFFSLFFVNKERLWLYLGILFLLIFFSFGQIALSYRISDFVFGENFVFFNKFIYPFITGGVLLSIKNDSYYIEKIWYWIRSLFLVNGLVIIFGWAFDLMVLQTYPASVWKFGYSGFLFAQNEASYFYIIGILLAYVDFLSGVRRYFFFFLIVTSLLIGTKAVYFFLLMLILYHFTFHFSRRIFRNFVLVFLAGVVWLRFIDIEAKLVDFWSIFIMHYNTEGLLSALLSGRNSFIGERFYYLIFSNWTPLNFLVGGHDITRFYIELAFHDLFLMFGGVGFFLYMLLFFKFVLPFSFFKEFSLFSILSLLLIAGTSGHFFEGPLNAIYLVFLGVFLKQRLVESCN